MTDNISESSSTYNPLLVGDPDVLAGLVANLCQERLPMGTLPSVEEVEARLGWGTHRWYMVPPETMIKTIVTLYEEKRQTCVPWQPDIVE